MSFKLHVGKMTDSRVYETWFGIRRFPLESKMPKKPPPNSKVVAEAKFVSMLMETVPSALASSLAALDAHTKSARAEELASLTTAAENFFKLAGSPGQTDAQVKELFEASNRCTRAALSVLGSITG